MINPQHKSEIIQATQQVYQDLYEQFAHIEDAAFTHDDGQRWSIILQMDHLIRSSKPVASALKLPKITFRAFGIPSGEPRTYMEIVKYYQEKLQAGAKASGKYIPSTTDQDKSKVFDNWMMIGEKLADRIDRHWEEEQLDRYLLPHPVLGRITVREMLFFTIYHTQHHQKSMNSVLEHHSANT